jgi:peptidoglycan hydrolase-like protein with peptidoglycan-binding domain
MKLKFGLSVRQNQSRFLTNEKICLFAARPSLYLGYDHRAFQKAVDDLQTILHSRKLLAKLNGEYDKATEEAVRTFQAQADLFPDGIVGSLTWAALCYPCLSRQVKADPKLEWAVKTLQERLCIENFLTKIDGFFGKQTEHALKRFQKSYGLHPDGICNSMTWAILLGQKNKPVAGFLIPRREVVEQLLMIISVYVGILLSPLGTEPPIAEALGTAYGLACIAPPIMDRLKLEILHLPLLQFSPF